MASESTEERTVSVDLPTDLADWLDEQANSQEMDREALLVQLLAAYRETAEFDGEFEDVGADSGAIVDSLDEELEDVVSNILVDVLDERVFESVQEQFGDRIESEVEAAVDSAVTAQVNEATNAVQKQLDGRIDSVEGEFQEKIEDVRSRVIQVKKEADSKAPSDHSHEELEVISALEEKVSSLEQELSSLEDDFDEQIPEHEDRLDSHTEKLEQMQDRLQTIAWVVSDLREAHQSGGLAAVERIKRAAAQADIERADCENCGNGVNLSLLTDPNCPHCDATVTNVEPSSGWFSSPTLLVASQLESGETNE